MKVNYPNTFWDTRYSTADYAYGVEPNRYFQQCLDRIPTPGRLLLLDEGEGHAGLAEVVRAHFQKPISA